MSPICQLRTCVARLTVAPLLPVEIHFFFFDVLSQLDNEHGIVIKPGRCVLLIEESFGFLKNVKPIVGERYGWI